MYVACFFFSFFVAVVSRDSSKVVTSQVGVIDLSQPKLSQPIKKGRQLDNFIETWIQRNNNVMQRCGDVL